MKKIILLSIMAFFLKVSYAQKVKFQAMSIYDFTRMLQWPEDCRKGDFLIKVYGDSEITDEVKAFTKDKKVNGRQKIMVEQTKGEKIGNCHILIIAETKSPDLKTILHPDENKNTLIVTLAPDLTDKGAGISFIKDGKGRYYYNLANIIDKDITVSTFFKQIGECN